MLSCCTAAELSADDRVRIGRAAAERRDNDREFRAWAAGYGVIRHDDLTQVRVAEMIEKLVRTGALSDPATGYRRLVAADIIASAGLWLVVHMTYAKRVRIDGLALEAEDFKSHPEGHTGGSLNMVPAYAAYLAINALDGITRGWLMGQGHCVAAVDAINVIVGNMTEAHATRYSLTEKGLSQLVSDFYSYSIGPDGRPESPIGSHVNANTAGGLLEGGYLGFAELQYVHAPLPGERLVAFLSDGAFEEQRGSDWAPRWWRKDDCGFVAPIMILNGRRIEQRSQIDQMGGETWLHRHLQLNGFSPIGLDGHDPASIVWGIFMMESMLEEAAKFSRRSELTLPYAIAKSIKGYGFPGAGTNRAHNLPLPGNPTTDIESRRLFVSGAKRLFVETNELQLAVSALATHADQQRPLERDHSLATRNPILPRIPKSSRERNHEQSTSPMAALDQFFADLVEENPQLRPRVGNPDESRSNRLDATLDSLKHRVIRPEHGTAESETGKVITALNEEAVVCAALGNKGGINLVVTYEAFATKMLGAIRQEATFARQLALAGRPPGWLSIPIVLTSHTWENAKNEISHQDPTTCEALLGEMSDTVAVVFPADANTTIASLANTYLSRGKIVIMVVPKQPVPNVFTPQQAAELVEVGLAVVRSTCTGDAGVIISATGSYQLAAAIRACDRLEERGVPYTLVYILEPGRLGNPRDDREAEYVVAESILVRVFPPKQPRLLVTHTRPAPFLGTLRRIDTGPKTTRAVGFLNQGGTLSIDGMMFANKSTWAHLVKEVAHLNGVRIDELLSEPEIAAVNGGGNPAILFKL